MCAHVCVFVRMYAHAHVLTVYTCQVRSFLKIQYTLKNVNVLQYKMLFKEFKSCALFQATARLCCTKQTAILVEITHIVTC